MNKALFKKYATIQQKISLLEEAKQELRSDILLEMQKSKVEKAETDYGIFTHAVRRTWMYTDEVKKLEEKVKIAKVKEEQKGLAKEKKTDYLLYTA